MITMEGQIQYHIDKLHQFVEAGDEFFARCVKVLYTPIEEFSEADQEFFEWLKREREIEKRKKKLIWRLRAWAARRQGLATLKELRTESAPPPSGDHVGIGERYDEIIAMARSRGAKI